MLTPESRKAWGEPGSRESAASQPIKPPKSPMSEPWVSCVVGSDPLRSNSTSTCLKVPSIRSSASLPIRSAAAQWELDGPRITGPITSLNMLTIMVLD